MTDEHEHPLDAFRHGRGYNWTDAAEAAIAENQALDAARATALTFTDYQARAALTSVATARRLEYLLPGLAAEVGELCDIFAKGVRDQGGQFHDGDMIRIQKEAGDVIWFVSELCRLMGLPLDNVARANLAKLADRQARGKLGGSGDER